MNKSSQLSKGSRHPQVRLDENLKLPGILFMETCAFLYKTGEDSMPEMDSKPAIVSNDELWPWLPCNRSFPEY